MKRLIYIIAFIFSIGAFAQGGPKVDVIKFRGEVTTAVRNGFDVPTGETWLIFNVTSGLLEFAGDDDVWESVGDGIQAGANDISSEGISLNQGLTNTVQVLPDLNGNPSIRIIGGNGDDAVYQVMSDDKIDWNFTTNSRNYQLNASGPTIGTDLTDKAYVDAQIAAVPGDGTGTDDQNASEVTADVTNFNGLLSATDDTVQKALETLDEVVTSGSDNSLSEVDQIIAAGVTRRVDLASATSAFNIEDDIGSVFRVLNNIIYFDVLAKSPEVPVSNQDVTNKLYVDNQDNLQDEAIEITYDNTTSGLTATNVKAAIDELENEIDGVSAGVIATTFKDVTATDYTLLTADKDPVKLRFNNASDITISEPATKSNGDPYRIVQYGAGKVGTDFYVNVTANDSIYARTTGPGNNFFIEYDNANTRWDITGAYESYSPIPPNPFPGNVYDFGDAADPNIETATIGSNWETPGSLGEWSVSSDAFDGDNSIAFSRLASGSLEYGFDIPVVSGNSYTITLYAKHSVGTQLFIMYLRTFEGWNVQQETTISGSTYAEYTITGVATSTGNARVNFKAHNGSVIGDTLLIDRIVAIETP